MQHLWCSDGDAGGGRGEEDEAVGRVREGLAREAYKGAPPSIT